MRLAVAQMSTQTYPGDLAVLTWRWTTRAWARRYRRPRFSYGSRVGASTPVTLMPTDS